MKNVFFILQKKRNRLFGQSDSIFNIIILFQSMKKHGKLSNVL